MAHIHELRLMARVARLYHEQGQSQRAIAEQLELSQPTISRLLKRAEAERIVRVVVTDPSGTHPGLENELQSKYGLREAFVIETAFEEEALHRDLGAAAAYYLETTLKRGDVVGLSSWSSALLAMVDFMRAPPQPTGSNVVQILGGVGSPEAEVHATHLTQRLAKIVGGEARLLPAPGVVGSQAARSVLFDDSFVRDAIERLEQVTVALVGIGAVEPSRLLAASGNIFSSQELDALRRVGAVGDVCLRFFDVWGKPVQSELNKRVIGMTLEQLQRVKRTIGIAGAQRKYEAILGALRGRWVNILITDRVTAERLVTEE
jgi:DNA-binding transcriptional regulator LsrR (DeoR family)